MSPEDLELLVTRTMPFGKHKGSSFMDVPPSYLEWMLREMKDLDGDLKYSINLAIQKKKKK